MMQTDNVEHAKRCGLEDGYESGRKQDFVSRGLMCFALSCAGDYPSQMFAESYLEGLKQALEDLRKEGVVVNDPRDKNHQA